MECVFVKTKNSSLIPTQATTGSCGFDIISPQDVLISPHSTTEINLNISFKMPKGCYGHISDRSSLAIKNITVLGGIIDSDYRKNLILLLRNLDSKSHTLSKGSKIAQIIFLNYLTPKLLPCTDFPTESDLDPHHGFGPTDPKKNSLTPILESTVPLTHP